MIAEAFVFRFQRVQSPLGEGRSRDHSAVGVVDPRQRLEGGANTLGIGRQKLTAGIQSFFHSKLSVLDSTLGQVEIGLLLPQVSLRQFGLLIVVRKLFQHDFEVTLGLIVLSQLTQGRCQSETIGKSDRRVDSVVIGYDGIGFRIEPSRRLHISQHHVVIGLEF